MSKLSTWCAFMILVIFVAYFSPDATEFITKSEFWKRMEFYNFLVIGIFVCYGLIGWGGDGENVEEEMSLGLGFMESTDYMGEILDVEVLKDCIFDYSSDGERGIGGTEILGDEWLGLPVRSLKSLVNEKRGVTRGDKCFGLGCEDLCEVENRVFGELGPLNLLENFNGAAKVLRVDVDLRIRSCAV